MKLFYSTTSPYSRKTRLAVRFKQLDEQVEEIICNPFTDAPEQSHQNPLGKVPTLILDDDTTIFDSPVICEYLDKLSPHALLYPEDTRAWVSAKTTESLADGILDAAYNVVMERRRPEGESSPAVIDQWLQEINRSLPFVEDVISTLGTDINIAHISIYCALGYLDFRLPDLNWRDALSSGVTKWYEDLTMNQPFFDATKPY